MIDDDHQDKFAEKYQIKSTRLSNWNYSTPGYYFITICTLNQNQFFGKVVDNKMILSPKGVIVKEELLKTFEIRKNIILDEYTIMPNHIHLLIKVISNNLVETHCVRLGPVNDFAKTHCVRLGPDDQTHPNNKEFPLTNNGIVSNETYIDNKLNFNNIRKSNDKFINRDAYHASLQKISIKSNEVIPKIIKLFKGSVSSQCKKQSMFFGWQPRFYDKIIRTENEYFAIKLYIKNNPKNWKKDEYGL